MSTNIEINVPDSSGSYSAYHPETSVDCIKEWARKKNTAYVIGDIAYLASLVNGKKLVCVKNGTTENNALTLSSTAEGALITDGTVTWQIDSCADGNYTAAHQNCIYRGVDLTTYWNSGLMSINIQSGNFVGMHVGDYIMKSITVDGIIYSNVKWIIGDIDYHLHHGDGSTITTKHHVLVFPEGVLGTARMNEINTTEGGYVNSEMWIVTIPKYVTGIQTAFGESHVLKHREVLTNTVDMTTPSKSWPKYTGMSSGWAWYDVYVNIFNEAMVYGATPWSSSGHDVGDCNTQVSVMRFNKSTSFSRSNWSWLRVVISSTGFANADGDGNANIVMASSSAGCVRPYFLLT